jgi:hypothetical protein
MYFGGYPKTVLTAINIAHVRNVLSIIQAKIWPEKHVIHPNVVINRKRVRRLSRNSFKHSKRKWFFCQAKIWPKKPHHTTQMWS